MARLDRPMTLVPSAPLIVLIHGLTGCEDSTYVRRAAHFHLLRGRTVLRLNLRGAGPSRGLAKGNYHAGSAPDVQDVIEGFGNDQTRDGVFFVGFSLGGNILLNLLAALPVGHRVIGAATVSAPIEPLEACRRIMAPRNALYHRWLLRRMKQDVLASGGLSAGEREAVERAKSVFEFDDNFVAPRNGFRDAIDYYERTAGAWRLPDIAVPTLLLHACNDPWIPVRPYIERATKTSKSISILVARSGGHVGFHERGYADTWHDRMIDRFLAQRIASASTPRGPQDHS
jgi:predicted alpha/beta-fold hydrolase